MNVDELKMLLQTEFHPNAPKRKGKKKLHTR
jgi:hypothetical protein